VNGIHGNEIFAVSIVNATAKNQKDSVGSVEKESGLHWLKKLSGDSSTDSTQNIVPGII
jgi:hypothetical protein